MRRGKKFWTGEESYVFLNPRMDPLEQEKIQSAIQFQKQKASIWVKSSGTESGHQGVKMVCLSKRAMLIAAQSVNDLLSVTEEDVWLNPLPNFHVGGLAISARCFLSGATEVQLSRWNPQYFSDEIKSKKVSVSSLVPTQVYDLVKEKIEAPSTLRKVLVGGGAMARSLFVQALELGWPLVLSYGMTETSAAIAATSVWNSSEKVPRLKLLSHVTLSEEGEQFAIHSESLFTGYLWLTQKGLRWQETPEPFVVDDRLSFADGALMVLGRESELIKILGESVNLKELELKVSEFLKAPVVVVPEKNERKGYELSLFVEVEKITHSLEDINKFVMPFERFTEVTTRSQFPRSELGKVLKARLKAEE